MRIIDPLKRIRALEIASQDPNNSLNLLDARGTGSLDSADETDYLHCPCDTLHEYSRGLHFVRPQYDQEAARPHANGDDRVLQVR